MKKNELQEKMIMERLVESKKISKAEAIHLLGVSESTVRRLFIRLEERGAVVRSHGGIQLVPGQFSGCPIGGTSLEDSFAERACQLISSGDILFLSAGALSERLGLALARKLEAGSLSRITVFTNSLALLQCLCPVTTVNLLGGEYRSEHNDFVGYLAEENIKKLYFQKSFLAADGYDPEGGFTSREFNTARIKQLIVERSQRNYLLIDARNLEEGGLVNFTGKHRVDTVVADGQLDKMILSKLREQGVTLLL